MSQVELVCKEADFHFNKKHLTDPTVPMWVIRAKGESYYVDHVESTLPWSTKEAPDNTHTKGAIKFRQCLITIDSENCAKVTRATAADLSRLRNIKRGITRIITKFGASLAEVLKSHDIKHGPIKRIGGGCGSSFYITDIMNKEDVTMLSIAMIGKGDYRVLMPNEPYYSSYDNGNVGNTDKDDLYDDDEDYS